MKTIAQVGQTEVGYAVNGSKTLMGLFGLIAYVLIQSTQDQPLDPTVMGLLASLSGVGLGHKLWKAGRSPEPGSQGG